jgi:hypothetical protein
MLTDIEVFGICDQLRPLLTAYTSAGIPHSATAYPAAAHSATTHTTPSRITSASWVPASCSRITVSSPISPTVSALATRLGLLYLLLGVVTLVWFEVPGTA